MTQAKAIKERKCKDCSFKTNGTAEDLIDHVITSHPPRIPKVEFKGDIVKSLSAGEKEHQKNISDRHFVRKLARERAHDYRMEKQVQRKKRIDANRSLKAERLERKRSNEGRKKIAVRLVKLGKQEYIVDSVGTWRKKAQDVAREKTA